MVQIQKQKLEYVIVKNISIGGPKIKNNLVIKRLKNCIYLIFLICF